jgi:hypothetical protein
MSHFTNAGIHSGELLWSRFPYTATPVSDLKPGNSGFSFDWIGDPPLHGGEVKFIAEGTDVAYINIPISQDEGSRIFADHWGLGGLSPTIRLQRAGTGGSENLQGGSAWGSKQIATARLITEAEFQYKADHGVYARYLNLLHSGQLQSTKESNWTIVPITLQSETDPLPGYVVHVMVSLDGGSYQLSIMEKASSDCSSAVFSDQTGVITEKHNGQCAASR